MFLHLSEAKGEVGRQLVGEPEGDGEAVLDLVDGFGNPLRLAAYSAASHLPRPAGRWRMSEGDGEAVREMASGVVKGIE